MEPDVELALHLAAPPEPAVGTAVVAHGAGSGGVFVRAAFGPALAAAGWRLVSYDLRGHGRSTPVQDAHRLGLDAHVADLVAVAEAVDARLVGGVSMGAHASVRAAAEGALPELAGLLLVMPAWTGEPDVVAAANAVQAAELRRDGVPAVLARIVRDHPGWVADELAAAWPQHDAAAFAAGLDALAASPGPTPEQLAQVQVPAGVVALTDDPMHPAAVAQAWAGALPEAELVRVPFTAPGVDRSVLGDAAVAAWRRAASLSGSR